MTKRFTFIFAALALGASLSAFADDGSKMGKMSDNPAAVETRIKELHAKLKINDGQEALWKTVAQQMRDSAKAMREMNETRETNTGTMSAVDDLKSYGEIASMHADSMKKFLDAFTPLYNNMTDDQKKNADEIFRGHKEAKRNKK